MAERIGELAWDLNQQLKDKVKSLIAFSIALDESMDVSNVAQIGVFIRGVDGTLVPAQQILRWLIDTTTSNDTYFSLIGALNRLEVDWSRAVSMVMDGAPSMVRKKAGVMKLRENSESDFNVKIVEFSLNITSRSAV